MAFESNPPHLLALLRVHLNSLVCTTRNEPRSSLIESRSEYTLFISPYLHQRE